MEQTCQMRALVKGIIAEGRVRPGSIFWTSPDRATKYIDQGVAEPIGVAIERAPMYLEGIAEKKTSSPAGQAGPSTDTRKSSEDGLVKSSPASPRGPASRASKPKKPAPRGKQSR